MAPDGYLRGVLADGALPFRYRAGVRELLGYPPDHGVRMRFASAAPRAGFTYLRRYADGPAEPDAPQWMSLAAADLAEPPVAAPARPRPAQPVAPSSVASRSVAPLSVAPPSVASPGVARSPVAPSTDTAAARPAGAERAGTQVAGRAETTVVIPGATARPGRPAPAPAPAGSARRQVPDAHEEVPGAPPGTPPGGSPRAGAVGPRAAHPGLPEPMSRPPTVAAVAPARAPSPPVASPDTTPGRPAQHSSTAPDRPRTVLPPPPGTRAAPARVALPTARPAVAPAVSGAPEPAITTEQRALPTTTARSVWRPTVTPPDDPHAAAPTTTRPYRRATPPRPAAPRPEYPAEAPPPATPPIVVLPHPQPPPAPAGTPLFWERRYLSRLRARILR